MGPTGCDPRLNQAEFENASPNVLEIESDRHPLQYLNLVVMDESGSVLSEGYYGDLFSPRGEIDTLRLEPGAIFRHIVSLLGGVPSARQLPGTFTVQAVYEYNGLETVSEPLAVKLTGEGN